MQTQHKMAVITMRMQTRHPSAKDLLHVRDRLQLTLQLGSDVPGIWFWAVGPASHDEVVLQEPGFDPEIWGLWQEIADLLRSTPQPVLGVAVGQVSKMAAMLLWVCDYVFAVAPSVSTMKAELGLGTQTQNSHLSSADVVLETTEALYQRCERMAQQIENLNPQELMDTKEILRHMKLQKESKAFNRLSEEIHRVVSACQVEVSTSYPALEFVMSLEL
eukprot:TRINITY_DN41542_c0_g1_i1.p1 TRINITY_DN41542_c0_g1~~TRINITY_DN41542_c0_g1_i1.p1  ORF type:complete len:228 (+),score=47.18 TRINITY_DN41542_c0_g1_i1:32-685(+)